MPSGIDSASMFRRAALLATHFYKTIWNKDWRTFLSPLFVIVILVLSFIPFKSASFIARFFFFLQSMVVFGALEWKDHLAIFFFLWLLLNRALIFGLRSELPQHFRTSEIPLTFTCRNHCDVHFYPARSILTLHLVDFLLPIIVLMSHFLFIRLKHSDKCKACLLATNTYSVWAVLNYAVYNGEKGWGGGSTLMLTVF